jgi:hypothetical protein
MTDNDWKLFLQTGRRLLGRGAWDSYFSDSWCAYTTFSSLEHYVNYWNCGFPEEDECLDSRTADGGLWRQSFEYSDLAHIVVPATFYWERYIDGTFQYGQKTQDIGLFSTELNSLGITHRKTDLVLEIKLY